MKDKQRLRVVIRGAVQGVGFRPFIYKLATSLQLDGWIINSSQGVFLEVEGLQDILRTFLLKIETEKPIHAYIQSLESSYLDVIGYQGFEIRKSEDTGKKTVLVLPDIATCPECLSEVFDSTNRRYLYPFTNCTLCGPRYTIIDSLPYDRPGTSMKDFPMCHDCLEEYNDPNDRRFHAQPNACPKCGPYVYATDSTGKLLARDQEAIERVANELRAGKIAAVKGLGGFHLIVDAGNQEAIDTLRQRKRRNEKPFAVMMMSLEEAAAECELDESERRLLQSPESPIVLLNRRLSYSESRIAENVAPSNPTLGVMLPYTPLHHILLRAFERPVVATSGNLSDEPICIDESEALERLGGIADLFLFHNRPILRQVDDSVARIMAGRELVLRRARGYAPLPVNIGKSGHVALAVGAHQKNTVAFQIGSNAIISQHLGDLETEQSLSAFQNAITSIQSLFEVSPENVVTDFHADYLSTKYAKELELPLKTVQHHHAHIASCMAENQLTGDVLGVAWDGTGAGTDGTIWGGEFLKGNEKEMERVGHFKTFPLPGSGQAVKEPRRTALGLLFEAFADDLSQIEWLSTFEAFSSQEKSLIIQMLQSNFNSPLTSSAGRLFDALSSLVGLCQVSSFEGQGAMELEFSLAGIDCQESYGFDLGFEIDWRPMVKQVIEDIRLEVGTGVISAKFHNTMAEIIVAVAARQKVERVVLSGGCFQNRYLMERTISRLQAERFKPYWHQRVPPNDGGIALGQIYAGNR
ncbi:MAG: carbamoyltransferase HypF [Proteobacteria bacterium]|nr:carbamoyltransferase HypF [Pseudomonadota bacterium]